MRRGPGPDATGRRGPDRSEEHTSELQHLYISYAVFCLKKNIALNRMREERHRLECLIRATSGLDSSLDPEQTLRKIARTAVFFFNDPATTEIYTLSLPDALPI